MGIADNSQTERIRVLRARTLAAFRRASPAPAPEFGPGGQTFPESDRQTRSFGQRTYTRMNAAGTQTTTLGPCCPVGEQAPPG
jgi:hypothetical protein